VPKQCPPPSPRSSSRCATRLDYLALLAPSGVLANARRTRLCAWRAWGFFGPFMKQAHFRLCFSNTTDHSPCSRSSFALQLSPWPWPKKCLVRWSAMALMSLVRAPTSMQRHITRRRRAPPPSILYVVLNADARGPHCATKPVGTGIETRDGSVVFLAPNQGVFVREATCASTKTELSSMDVARALPSFFLASFARDYLQSRRWHFSPLPKGITSNCSYLAAGKTHPTPLGFGHTFCRVDYAAGAPT
jgi:hypothetical protein